MIVKHPLYLLIGLILVILPVFLFHIILFGKSKKFNQILCSLIAGMYISVTVDIVLGVSHLFYPGVAVFLSSVLVIVVAYFSKRRIFISPFHILFHSDHISHWQYG
ncbi:MAG: hypothetical protein PVF58_06670 [Candidatus Methanofastidiosia archaeon]|jgi:hypothetical protein